MSSSFSLPASQRHFLDLGDLRAEEIRHILDGARRIKARRRTPQPGDRVLAGKSIAMIFEQPSMRTRMSFDMAIRELGGESIMVTGKEIELGERESIADTARVLSRYVDGIMIRILDHRQLVELAENATIPVLNGLTKTSHPCQVMADVLTFEEHRGPIAGRTVTWVGDSNNVLRSWIEAAGRLGFSMRVATPEELQPKADIVDWARANKVDLRLMRSPQEAVEGTDCVVADCWVSMGDKDAGRRHNLLRPYQVNAELMRVAGPQAIFMHCLPAKRGEEVTDEVMDGPQSVVFDEAENRLHAQKAILAWAYGESFA
ncbi:MAG: ornithine carbamoyltransferase [Beijerinckiaceae bacterium]|nr:ornithine carbamoyltransferase [Beijerinckiaceae bacterium]MCZ8299162.1 ornithine carbamoyltransferase [Beijerinckiaceae bacterium]